MKISKISNANQLKKTFFNTMCIMMSCVMAISLMVVGPSPAAAADEYDTLRERWKETLTGSASYNTSDPNIAARITEITDKAQEVWDSMIKTPGRTQLWAEYAIGAPNTGSKGDNLTPIYANLKYMALAYSTRGSSLEGNTTLRDDIISGLDWMHANKFYYGAIYSGNWWHMEIGAPQQLNAVTVLMYDDLTSTQVTNYMDAVNWVSPEIELTGANRSWKAGIIALRGVIVKDSAKIAHATAGLSQIFDYVTDGDGFYVDGSFIQHSHFPYTGGYGLSLLESVSNLMYLVEGSSFAVTDPDKQNVYQWIYNAYEPLIYKGAMMDMVRGREISRHYAQDHTEGHVAIRSILQLSDIASPTDATAFKRMVKYWMQNDTFSSLLTTSSIHVIEKATALLNNNTIAPRDELLAYRQYAGMDRAVQLRPGYGYGISMHSNRVANYESINAENGQAWHTADGMTYLYNNDLSQFTDNYWPTVNRYQLPGTTVLHNTTATSGAFSDKNWVGGTEISGLYGVTGMELHPSGKSLAAKKSWFMFDDEIVALGAGITSADNIAVETIAENRKINSGGDNALTVNGSAKSTTLGWTENMTGVNTIHLAGNVAGSDIGYYFPGSANITGLREARTGNWKQLNQNSGTPTTPHTRNYLSLVMDHGVNPTNASYSYVTLPNKTSSQVSAYASNPNITILENSSDAQAVKENGLNMVGINFWNDSVKTVDLVTSNRKASVMTKETANDFEVSVSDPTQAGRDTINIEINKSATSVISADSGVVVTQLSPTIKMSVSVVGAHGKTFKAKFATTGTVVPLPAPTIANPFIIEAENLAVVATSDSRTINNVTIASGGKDSMFNGNQINDYIDYKVNVPKAGTYKITFRLYREYNHALYQLKIGDVNHGAPFDTYSTAANYYDKDMGVHTFEGPGDRIFRLTMVGTVTGKVRVDYIKLEPTEVFVKGVNFGGSAVTIEGNSWHSQSSALTSGMTISSNYQAANTVTPSPAVDTDTASMLNSHIWRGTNITIAQTLPNGTYSVYLWVMEDYQNNYRSFDVQLEGTVKGTISPVAVGGWTKYGPYTATVSDGALTMDLVKGTREPILMGMAIYSE
ncbi:polysaccharide lyase family 8 super-sandwich domain-containing protein [Paenibacillus sp. strain BS8-2]